MAKYLLNNASWDFFMVVFSLTDRISHRCWEQYNCMDKSIDPVSKAYKTVDRLIGELLSGVDKKTSLIILSDHGFGAVKRIFFTNSWLLEHGYLLSQGCSLSNVHKLYKLDLKRTTVGMLQNRIYRGKLSAVLPDAVKNKRVIVPLIRRKTSPQVVDWSRTRAYGANFGIYINLKGREPYGIVSSGAEYESLREEIIAKLFPLKDTETGEDVMDYVVKREDIYSGPFMNEAPDILFSMKGLSYIASSRFYFKKLFAMPRIPGGHRLNGIFIARGDKYKESHMIENARIVDIFPTILYSLNLSLPDDLDGEIIRDCFMDEVFSNTTPNYITTSANKSGSGYEDLLTVEEKDRLESMLKSLGYLDS